MARRDSRVAWADWLAGSGRAALDLVVAQDCAGCGLPGTAWCPACAARCAGPSIRVGGDGPAASAGVSGPTAAPWPAELPLRCAGRQDGAAGRAVVAFKDRAVRRLAGPLGLLLAGAVRDVLADLAVPTGRPVWLVPVPARSEARRRRGADHMGVIAGRAARALRRAGVPANRCSALRHARISRDQRGLGRAARLANVSGSLAARSVPAGIVVLVDDVTTTGATLAEARRALAAAGVAVSAAATLTWSAPPAGRATG